MNKRAITSGVGGAVALCALVAVLGTPFLQGQIESITGSDKKNVSRVTGEIATKQVVGGAKLDPEYAKKVEQQNIKRAEEAVKSVRGKADVVELSKAEQNRISKALRPIIDEWVKESEAKGIPARDMLKRAGYAL